MISVMEDINSVVKKRLKFLFEAMSGTYSANVWGEQSKHWNIEIDQIRTIVRRWIDICQLMG